MAPSIRLFVMAILGLLFSCGFAAECGGIGLTAADKMLNEAEQGCEYAREQDASDQKQHTSCDETPVNPNQAGQHGVTFNVNFDNAGYKLSGYKQSETIPTTEPQTEPPEDCFDLLQQGHTKSGRYKIYPFGLDGPLHVYCDMTTGGGGWTVFQKRQDGALDFYRNWAEYRDGFGVPGGEFWLGNKHISMITNQNSYTLRVDLEDFTGESQYAEYDHFRISDEERSFRLSLGRYVDGSAGDSLSHSANMNFTTKDYDRDLYSGNCAVINESAWWYKDCYLADLNSAYRLTGLQERHWQGIIWKTWKGSNYSLKRTEMKIRPYGAMP